MAADRAKMVSSIGSPDQASHETGRDHKREQQQFPQVERFEVEDTKDDGHDVTLQRCLAVPVRLGHH